MKPDKLQNSLLAQFHNSLSAAASACPQTRTVLKRLQKKENTAEGIGQVESWDAWPAARRLYHAGHFTQRE